VVRAQIKPLVASVGIGLAVCGLLVYALTLLSVTQNLTRHDPPFTTGSR
jgi:hypothetical protein